MKMKINYVLLSFLIVSSVSAAPPTNIHYERSKMLGSYYFRPAESADLIGIVLVSCPFDGERAFIGAASGANRADADRAIAERGARFPLEVAKALIK